MLASAGNIPHSFRSSLLYLFQKHSPCPQHMTVTLHDQNPRLFPTQAQVRATYNCSPGAVNSCRTPYCEKSKTFVVGSPEFESRVCLAASWSSASSQLLSEPRFSPLPIGQHRHLQGSWYHGNFKALGKHSDQTKAGDNMADVPGRSGMKPWRSLLLLTLLRQAIQSRWYYFPPL